MQNRDKIIAKIQKLLALANNNSNESECIEATLKAQKLIAEYSVEQDELSGNSEQLVSYFTYKFSGKLWRGYLANIIAQNFRCMSFMQSVRDEEDNFKLRHTCCFIGYKHDIQAALAVYNYCVEVGERLAKERFRYYKENFGSAEGVKNTFLEGFCSGIQKELSKQCEALALKTPEAIVAYMDMINFNVTSFNPTILKFDDYEEGLKSGERAIRSRQIESKNNNMLVE